MEKLKAAATHLRVALVQSLPTDDQIIISHMRDALSLLEEAIEELRPK